MRIGANLLYLAPFWELGLFIFVILTQVLISEQQTAQEKTLLSRFYENTPFGKYIHTALHAQ
jgi:hypothetical protein